MSVIYMVHPVHGAKVAISEQEANYDEMHGWERYSPNTPVPAAVEEADAPAPVVNALTAPRRRGRPRPETKE